MTIEQNTEKTEKSPAPVVSIDGNKIRTMREANKLTQLYVASVVGVTTDTISRWENNRYPTIKRDNALRLAGALEVDLAAILREEEPAAPTADVTPPPRLATRWPSIAGIMLVLLAVGTTVFLLHRPGQEASVTRRLPAFSPPGECVPVQLVVSSTGVSNGGLIVKEKLPPGWQLVQAAPAAATLAAVEEIKWLLPAGKGNRTISYTVRSPQAAPLDTKVIFNGQLVTQVAGHAQSAAIGGDRQMVLAARHWADRNGDGKIDDNEIMPAYYLTEEMKGLGLDWLTIEKIWSSSGYGWDASRRGYVFGQHTAASSPGR
jgi:transcriptional regulator with XRE-family HTH domain